MLAVAAQESKVDRRRSAVQVKCVLYGIVREKGFMSAFVRGGGGGGGVGGVTRGGQCTFSGFLNSTRSAVSDPTSHYPRPPRKRPGGPKIPKIVTGSDQKIKIPKKKGVVGQGLYLAYSYFLAHKRDMAMATAHDSYFRK